MRIRRLFINALVLLVVVLPANFAKSSFIPGFELGDEPGGGDARPAVGAASAANRAGNVTDPATGMEFVPVPGGCFQMGSPDSEKDRGSDEGPVHEVCVDGFVIGKYEVTQGQWQKVMGNNPASFKKGDNYPVEQVAWNDVQEFIGKLNRQSGKNYRLPTEAEWEYAASGGTTTPRYWGDNPDQACAYANVHDHTSKRVNTSYTWENFNSDDGYDKTSPVGSFKPNSFGLYDMLGNVWEWNQDWYGDKYYGSSPRQSPTGPTSGSDRVNRGGGWGYGPDIVRAANRSRSTPGSCRAGAGGLS